jgi:CubicO group peptidase (beta-lactamase class C family)
MNSRALLALLAVATVGANAITAQSPDATELIAAIEGPQDAAGPNDLGDKGIEALMAELGVPGVSVAVIHDFRIHWAKGYGVADVETQAPVDTETLFQAASISKPVAAMAVMKSVQDGLFSLDTDVNEILTSWTLEGGRFTSQQPVTPRSLTSHTSGLGDGFGFPGYEPGEPVPTIIQILDGEEPSNVRKLFMERAPYVGEEYSGGGVTLMQLALTDALQRPFPEILDELVLEPIGMSNSTFQQPLSEERDANAARGHDAEGMSRGPKWHVYPELAAAGLWTTPSDLARLAIEVQKSALGESNLVLSRGSVMEMLTPVGVGSYAVGFSISQRGRGWYFGHGGANWGFRATLLAHRLKGYGLAIMTNGDRGGAAAAEISRRIQEAYGWDSLDEPLPRGYDPPRERTYIELPVSVLGAYVGRYEKEDGEAITVSIEEGQLIAVPNDDRPLPIFPESETVFSPRSVPAVIEFVRAASGETEALIVRQGPYEERYDRVR